MVRDTLFETDNSLNGAFTFDEKVAAVFDDMVSRSVPHYDTIQNLLMELSLRLHEGRPVVDIGCSTGTTLQAIAEKSEGRMKLIGIDNSEAMLETARCKLGDVGIHHDLRLICADLLELDQLDDQSWQRESAGVVILCLVLQFIRPVQRKEVLAAVYDRIASGGCLLLVEKVVSPCTRTNSLFIDTYHDYKLKMGYSMNEIRKKREALENRLIPYYPSENLDMLREVGFSSTQNFFCWLNFQGYIAFKS